MAKTLEESGRHAFPTGRSYGMTLRDYFAAKAMQSGLSIPVKLEPDVFAIACYSMADAMLKARQQ